MSIRSDSNYDAETGRIRDSYARRMGLTQYSWFSPGQLFMVQRLEEEILNSIRATGAATLKGRRILDVGCGNGFWIRKFIEWGADPADVSGIELIEARSDCARRMSPARVSIYSGNAAEVVLPVQTFDIVTQFTVFTSILDSDMRKSIAQRMVEMVRPGGFVLWYDFFLPTPNNPDVRAVGRREIEALFPRCRIDLRRTTLVPPLVRLLARYSFTCCRLLEGISPLRSHYIGVIRP